MAMYRAFILSFIALVCCTDSASLLAMSRTTTENRFISESIGVRTLRYNDNERDRPVVVEFWYPTDENNAEIESTEDSVWVHPKESRNVSFSQKTSSCPLILMSHGHRGDRRERTWLVDSLVRQGYLVASIEHYGNCWNQFNPIESFCFWDRAKDVTFALDRLLEDDQLKTHIDPNRIGFVGYSMGGMTGLSLAGAQVKNAREIAKQQLGQLNNVQAETLNHMDFTAAEKNYQDPRIRSMLLICPATFAFLPETLKKIKIPIGLIASIDDEVLPHKEHAQRLMKHATPYKLKLLRNKTSHYAFLNHMTKKGYALLAKALPSDQSHDWTPIHKEATTFTIKFFQETLQKK